MSYFYYGICYLISLLPLWLLYIISDGFFVLIYYVIRYRRKLVNKNLRDSFPNKDEKEIRDIEKRYYHWLCDYVVETVKMTSMSQKQIQRRMQFKGLENVEDSFANGRPCSLFMGHYCNWEWVTSLPLWLKSGICAQIYHPLENEAVDRTFAMLRTRFGATNIKMDDTFRTVMTWKQQSQMSIIGYIADQVPGLHNVHLWVDFLNHDTPVFTGAERITNVTGADAYFAVMTRPKRGYYVCEMVKLELPNGEYTKFFYTREYYRLLEQSIQKHPEFWLWSHNRWKRDRKEFNELFSEEEQKKRLSRL